MRNYKIITSSDIKELEDSINGLLSEGYSIVGGITIETNPHYRALFHQAIYKEDTNATEEILKKYGIIDDIKNPKTKILNLI